MSVIRVHKNKNFTVMSNTHLRDKNLSLKAKGLLSVMLSLPDDWDYSIAGLCAICKENETAVKSALNELKTSMYVIVERHEPTKENGGRIRYEYEVYEEPQPKNEAEEEKQESKKQGTENLGVEYQGVEFPGQLNNNKPNKEEPNKSKTEKTCACARAREVDTAPSQPQFNTTDWPTLKLQLITAMRELGYKTGSRKFKIANNTFVYYATMCKQRNIPLLKLTDTGMLLTAKAFLSGLGKVKGNNEYGYKALIDEYFENGYGESSGWSILDFMTKYAQG